VFLNGENLPVLAAEKEEWYGAKAQEVILADAV